MKLFGLRDEDGKEYEVVLPDHNAPPPHDTGWDWIFLNGEISIRPISDRSKPEFEVGDWVVFDNPTQEGLPVIFRITRVENNYVLDDRNTSYGKTKYLRLADTDEIESHKRRNNPHKSK